MYEKIKRFIEHEFYEYDELYYGIGFFYKLELITLEEYSILMLILNDN